MKAQSITPTAFSGTTRVYANKEKPSGDYPISDATGLGKYAIHMNDALLRINLDLGSRCTEIQRAPNTLLFIFSNPEVQSTKSGMGEKIIFQIEYGQTGGLFGRDRLYTKIEYKSEVRAELFPKEDFLSEHTKYDEPMTASEADEQLYHFLPMLERQTENWRK